MKNVPFQNAIEIFLKSYFQIYDEYKHFPNCTEVFKEMSLKGLAVRGFNFSPQLQDHLDSKVQVECNQSKRIHLL